MSSGLCASPPLRGKTEYTGLALCGIGEKANLSSLTPYEAGDDLAYTGSYGYGDNCVERDIRIRLASPASQLPSNRCVSLEGASNGSCSNCVWSSSKAPSCSWRLQPGYRGGTSDGNSFRLAGREEPNLPQDGGSTSYMEYISRRIRPASTSASSKAASTASGRTSALLPATRLAEQEQLPSCLCQNTRLSATQQSMRTRPLATAQSVTQCASSLCDTGTRNFPSPHTKLFAAAKPVN